MGLPPDLVRRLTGEAATLDDGGRFPPWAREALREAGLLLAPFPRELGGEGLATDDEPALAELLIECGAAWMPLGRIVEGHANAIRLVWRYGTTAQLAAFADDARAGHLSAVWAADLRGAPFRLHSDGRTRGEKAFASGAGVVTRPLVTAEDRNGAERLLYLRLPAAGATVTAKPDLLGMRGASTSRVDLSGLLVDERDVVGQPGDYLREPELSLGAWRPLAVMAGGIAALVAAFAADLLSRERDRDPHQRVRLGDLLILREQAALWVGGAAARTAHAGADPVAGERAAEWVKLARNAIDQAAAQAIALAQRGAGFAAAARPHPIERLCRDLATLARQPALDEVLESAGAAALRGVL